MKILIISQFLPYPLDAGGKTRLFNLFKNYRQNGLSISLLAIIPDKVKNQLIVDLEKLLPGIKLELFQYKPSMIEKILYYFLFLFHLESRCFKSLKIKIDSAVEQAAADIIQVEFTQTARYLAKSLKERSILMIHELRFLKTLRKFCQEKNLLKKVFLFFQYRFVRAEETRYFKIFSILKTTSIEDQNIIKKINSSFTVEVSPNGVDTSSIGYMTRQRENKSCYLLGWFGNEQNLDSLQYFIVRIYPLIKNAVNNIIIIGKDLPKKFRPWVGSNAQYYEYIQEKEIGGILAGGILLVPLRYGGGTRLKILEAMARGNPVISSSIGAEGLGVKNGKNILIADTPPEFVSCLKLLDDLEFRQSLTLNARRLVEEKYDWQTLAGREIAWYKKVNLQNK